MDPADFRSQVVNFLRQLPQLFADKISSTFTSFEAYLQSMSRPSTWGDELTLQAASCLLLTPIRVLSDSEVEPERRLTPPPTIAQGLLASTWGAVPLGSVSITIPRCSMSGIFTYIWVMFRANVGKYSIHGASWILNKIGEFYTNFYGL